MKINTNVNLNPSLKTYNEKPKNVIKKVITV